MPAERERERDVSKYDSVISGNGAQRREKADKKSLNGSRDSVL